MIQKNRPRINFFYAIRTLEEVDKLNEGTSIELRCFHKKLPDPSIIFNIDPNDSFPLEIDSKTERWLVPQQQITDEL